LLQKAGSENRPLFPSSRRPGALTKKTPVPFSPPGPLFPAGPILDRFEAWLKGSHSGVLPKNPLGEAIGCALNHWVALKRNLEAGFLKLDNEAVERGERTTALGRQNLLFAGSDRGAGRRRC
jgi:Transposase IS66 family